MVQVTTSRRYASVTQDGAGVMEARGARREPTMRDVAALAKVSTKTVSRVINDLPGAGPEVVERVRAAARALGYRPNLTASSLRRSDRRSATIGVLLEDLSNPFDAALLRAVEDLARQNDVLVLAGSSEDDAELQRELLTSLATRRVDGMVVMAAGGHQDALQQERERGTPMVLVDRPPTFDGTDSVTTTNRDGSRDAVLQLAGLGHRRIAFLGDRRTLWTSQERYNGYLEGLAHAGLTLHEGLVRTDLHGPDAAENATEILFDLEEPPTALFTAQNLVTVGAMRALRARGLHHSVALIGFDDFPLADMLEPGVTVLRQDVPALGRKAAELVFARIAGDHSPPTHAVVPATLIRRGSGEIQFPNDRDDSRADVLAQQSR
ncbi:LacI family transcriptional regulator [Saccharothrix sp. S26]|uniref:LacI family DNA-binding transcriptional regulator n=1 Tax=Saccharothrix sp. S26 TaxID=2907215 RepID=UPI001F27E3AE|nr:LacI family DNA-binding transcriptional regulator [Saccharothrix sp. S26]MCE6998535.1 LacI family transcriptional regulator [Saccharothrix sp. S26]